MRRFRFLVLCAVLTFGTLLAATAALGAFQSGTYKGETEQGAAIIFKATQGQVKKLRVNLVALCDSGYGSRGKFSNVHGPINSNGRFHIVAKFDRGATTLIVNGRLSGSYAGGKIIDKTTVNPEKEGEPDPKGTVKCSATIPWVASTA